MDEAWKHNAKAKQKVHILYEISRRGKSIETEGQIVVIRGGGRGRKQRVTGNGYRVSFRGG